MIVLINGGPALDRFGRSELLGALVSPRSGNVVRPGVRWAADNDAYSAWDEGRFVRMLNRIESFDRSLCLFVACPDVVCDARATLDRFWDWRYEVVGRGLPVALVGQNGSESMDLPWDALDAFFVGGDDAWKESAAAAALVAEARGRGKWTHMGRVNTIRRIRVAREFLCDSIDGTGWSKFPDAYLKNYLPVVERFGDQSLIWERAAGV